MRNMSKPTPALKDVLLFTVIKAAPPDAASHRWYRLAWCGIGLSLLGLWFQLR